MPQVIKAETSASPSKSNTSSSGKDPKKFFIIGGVVLGILVIGYFVFTTFAGPKQSGNPTVNYDKVAPPAGFPDNFPYNSKQWLDAGKPGISGMPPPGMGGMPRAGDPIPK